MKKIIIIILLSSIIIYNHDIIGSKSNDKPKIGIILKNKICEAIDTMNTKGNLKYRVYYTYVKDLNLKNNSFSFIMSYIMSTDPRQLFIINTTHILYYSNDIILIRFDKNIDKNFVINNFDSISKKDINNINLKLFDKLGLLYEPFVLTCKYENKKTKINWIDGTKASIEKIELIDWDYWKANEAEYKKISDSIINKMH